MKDTLSVGRREFLARAACATAAVTAGGSPVAAEPQKVLTMVTAWPKGAPGVGVNAQRFADRVKLMSGGRLDIKLYAGGELVPPFEALDAVAQGVADLAHSSPYYWVGKSKALNFFTGVPFGMTAPEFAAWLYFGGGQALWEKTYDAFNVQPFYAGSSGTQAGGWFKQPIETTADFKGLKFRIAGLGGEVLRRLGATPVMTPPAEIAPALASGAVDGADWVGPWNDIAFGLHRFAKHYYLPGFHEPGPALEVIVNRTVFSALPQDLQAIVRYGAQSVAIETLSDFAFHNIETFDAMETRYGVRVQRFPEPVVAQLRQTSAQVLAELAGDDELATQVHDSYMAFLGKASAYAPFGEYGFVNMRAPHDPRNGS